MTYPLSITAQLTNELQPGAIQERSHDLLDYYKIQERLQKEADPPNEEAVSGNDQPIATGIRSDQKIFVRRIQTDMSTILDSEAIQDITQRYEGQNLSLNDLSTLIAEINAMYAAKNIITAQAVLAPQKIENGLVKITLIEGRIGDILLQGNATTNANYIKKRVALKEGELLDIGSLEKQILFFNGTNDVKVRALLQPGKEFGTADVVLEAAEPKRWDVLVFEDNAGQEEVGLYRTGLNIINNSLLGRRDRLTVAGIWAKGTADAYISYDFPITYKGTRLGLSYNYSRTSIVSGPLEPLDIDGEAHTARLFVTQPLIVREKVAVNTSVGYNIKDSTTEFSDVPLFDSDVRSMNVGVDHTHLGEKKSFSLRHNFRKSFGAAGGDLSFFAYDGDFSGYMVVSENSFVLLRSRFQLSDADFLPSQEQFQIGGIASVRGYEEGFLINDNGYFVSGEYSFPLNVNKIIKCGSSLMNKFRGMIFVDHGETIAASNLARDADDILTSTGIGLTFDEIKDFSGRFVLGVPLRRFTGNDDPRFHFHIQYKF